MATKKSSKGSSKSSSKKSSKGASKGSSKKSGAKSFSAQAIAAEAIGLASVGETTVVQTHDVDVLSHMIGGCYKIVGSPVNLEVCYSFDATKKTVCVTVKLAGHTIGTACLNIGKPSYQICYSLAVVKACVGLNFNTSSLCLNFTAQACVHVPILGWQCKSYQGKIACFK